MSLRNQPPQADGLYDPRFEHDACGVAMVARLDNRPTHEVVDRALVALDNLEHRGAEGADIRTGDGAGILVQMPDAFLRAVAGFDLPPLGSYGVAQCFLPNDPARREKIEQLLEMNVRVEGQRVLGWRDVPVDEEHVGDTAAASRPCMRQLFIAAGPGFEQQPRDVVVLPRRLQADDGRPVERGQAVQVPVPRDHVGPGDQFHVRRVPAGGPPGG